jgi:hypothetical protein
VRFSSPRLAVCGHSSRGASGLGVVFVGALCRRSASRGVESPGNEAHMRYERRFALNPSISLATVHRHKKPARLSQRART